MGAALTNQALVKCICNYDIVLVFVLGYMNYDMPYAYAYDTHPSARSWQMA